MFVHITVITHRYHIGVPRESRNSLCTSNTPPQFNPMVSTLRQGRVLILYISFQSRNSL